MNLEDNRLYKIYFNYILLLLLTTRRLVEILRSRYYKE